MRATIGELIDQGIIVAHKDGNYGSLYPRTGDFGGTGTIFLTAKNVGDDGRIDFRSAQRLNDDKASAFKFGWIKNDDVLLSHNATVGRVAVVSSLNERALVGTSLTYFTLDTSRLLPGYFASFLRGRDFQSQLEAVMSYSTRNQVPITIQKQLSVDVPPFERQKAIAHILGTLDDKIELNRKTNETLEAMAKALFKSWFVDFDPVRAKAEGRSTGLPDEISDLFPDSFEDSELGEIPSGWKTRELGTLVKPSGEAIQASSITIEMPYVPIDCITSKSLSLREYKSGAEANTSLLLFRQGDFLFGAMRPYFHKVCIAPFDGTTRTTCFALRPFADSHYAFSAMLLSDVGTIEYATLHSTGSTIPYIRWSNGLENMPFIQPPNPIASCFNEIAHPILQRISSSLFSEQTVAGIRDILLPKLISGEIRIPDAERLLEEVGV